MVTKQEATGQWNALVGAIKEKYGQITDNEVARLDGDIDRLIGLVQRKSGKAREEIETFVHECGDSCGSALDKVTQYASAAGETLRDSYETTAKQIKSGYSGCVNAVLQHPLESVSAAFGVGLAAGLILGLSRALQRERDFSRRERWLR